MYKKEEVEVIVGISLFKLHLEIVIEVIKQKIITIVKLKK